jgi:hypothetical protein
VRACVEQFVRYVPLGRRLRSWRRALAGTDIGAERAVSIIGRDALLRRQWTVWEHVDERGGKPEPGEDQRRGLQGVGGGFGMLRRVDVASGWRPSMLKTRTKRS